MRDGGLLRSPLRRLGVLRAVTGASAVVRPGPPTATPGAGVGSLCVRPLLGPAPAGGERGGAGRGLRTFLPARAAAGAVVEPHPRRARARLPPADCARRHLR